MDGLNIFGDGSGEYMFTFMVTCGELLLYQRILLPGKAKVFVVELEDVVSFADRDQSGRTPILEEARTMDCVTNHNMTI